MAHEDNEITRDDESTAGEGQQILIKLSPTLYSEVEGYRELLEAEMRQRFGRRATMSDAVRDLLTTGLAAKKQAA